MTNSFGMQVSHERVTIAGDTLYVRTIVPDGMYSSSWGTLVFLHKGLGSIAQWKHFPEVLCKRVRRKGIVYDRKGHGCSDANDAEISIRFYEREAQVVLPALFAHEQIAFPILIGHSDGGTIALKYASLFPSALCAAVSIAAHVFMEEKTREAIRGTRDVFARPEVRRKFMRYHGKETDRLVTTWINAWLCDASADWNMMEDLQHITCPLLLLQGEDDDFGSWEQVERIQAHVSGPVEIFPISDCKHDPHIEAREQTLASITDFINRLERNHEIQKHIE